MLLLLLLLHLFNYSHLSTCMSMVKGRPSDICTFHHLNHFNWTLTRSRQRIFLVKCCFLSVPLSLSFYFFLSCLLSHLTRCFFKCNSSTCQLRMSHHSSLKSTLLALMHLSSSLFPFEVSSFSSGVPTSTDRKFLFTWFDTNDATCRARERSIAP